MALEDRQLGEAPLDALVHVAEPLLEPEHFLADDREAEVAGLDDAGVHRPDRDLVHAVAVDAHERVVVDCNGRLAAAGSSSRSGCASAGHAAWRSHGRSSGPSDCTPVRSAAARCMRAAAGKISCSPG